MVAYGNEGKRETCIRVGPICLYVYAYRHCIRLVRVHVNKVWGGPRDHVATRIFWFQPKRTDIYERRMIFLQVTRQGVLLNKNAPNL